jgi:hypothetical protein
MESGSVLMLSTADVPTCTKNSSGNQSLSESTLSAPLLKPHALSYQLIKPSRTLSLNNNKLKLLAD